MPAAEHRGRARLGFVLIAAATVIGLAGTDLVLPAVPSLPRSLGGTAALAQLVLAAFVLGAGAGLLLWGELGARFDQRRLLVASLIAYAILSLAAGRAQSLEALVALRLFQGAAGAAAAVFAPGMLRLLYDDESAVGAIGRLASIESLVPALAPVAGAWLVAEAGWRASFDVIALLGVLLAVAIAALAAGLPRVPPPERRGGYAALLRDPLFLRYALSHAFTLGGLLTFVFGAPAVITAQGGTIFGFVAMQVMGIAFFILAASFAGPLSQRHGAERMIAIGTGISAAAGLAILAYALAGGASLIVVIALFVPMNLGLGLRGPPGFMRAVLASHGDDARGAALVVLFILLAAAAGTAAAAPLIASGLAALAAVSAAILLAALLCLVLLPRLTD